MNYEHLFSRVFGYERVNDIMEVDITEFRVYPVRITNIQVGITFSIFKLIDGVRYMPKELNVLSDRVWSHWLPTRKSSHPGG